MNKKDWGIIAIVGYILSLPIMIWKSSRIGKLVFVFFLVGILGYSIKTITDVSLEAWYKTHTRQKIEVFKKDSAQLDFNIKALKYRIDAMDREAQLIAKQKFDELISNDKTKLNSLEVKIQEVENSIAVIKEQERQAVKDRLIELREQIKVNKKSIDSKEIRQELELIASNTQLLTADERKRLYDDLEQFGFGINRINENVVMISSPTYMMASACVVTPMDWNDGR